MKKIFALILSIILTVCLVACNSGSASSSAPDSSLANSTSAPDSGSAGSSGTPALDAIRESGKLRLLTEATFPPFEYTKGSGYAGVDIDIGQALADKLGVELEVIDMNFDLLVDALNADKGDFIAAGMSVTEERKEVVNFTKEYLVNGLMVILPSDSTAASFEDLAGKVIAVQEATTGDFLAVERIDTADTNILRFKSAVEAGNSVLNGKADAAVLDKLPSQTIVNGSNGKGKLMPGVYEEELTAIAVKKDKEDLLAFINETLDELEAAGKIQEFIDLHMVEALE